MGRTSDLLVSGLLLVLGSSRGGVAQSASVPDYPAEDDLIEVMFASGSRTLLRDGVLVDMVSNATAGLAPILSALDDHQWSRITQVSEQELDAMRARGRAKSGRPLYDLNNIYRLRISKGSDVWDLSRRLEALTGVHRARPVPRPVLAPVPSSYEAQQNYIESAATAPAGIDVRFAWAYPGGDGSGVTVCDLEYEWNYDHADVTKAQGSQINVDLGVAGFGSNHGTAVIGELVADRNGWGVTGICFGAALKTCGTYFGIPFPAWNVPGALIVAISNLQPGDVILIENQWDYTGLEDYLPIEWWTDVYPSPQSFNAVYAAIETAVANGINVVETGGNGEGDSGSITWYGDSGAIVVGAGGAYPGGTWVEGNLQKLSYSTYGPRFDLQGWGENVVTTGFGDLYNAEGPNYSFTNRFDGTSAAGPMVAGAVASCVGYWKANVSPIPPSPAAIRAILKSSGTPQVTPPFGNIGPRPNLRAAFAGLGVTAVDAGSAPRAQVVLGQNVPNPMNPSTRITFYTSVAGEVALTIYDIRGRSVRQLIKGWQPAGEQTVTWDGRGVNGARVASGMYLIQLDAVGETQMVKATLVK